jgi:fructose-bisphosphate aldolase, class I
MSNATLADTAAAMVAPGKGILAADESTGTIGKRFAGIDTPSTEQTRRSYRELLFTAEGLEQYISGVILYDETIRQSAADGTAFTELLARKGVLPGIKVDTGAHDLAGFAGETVTEGLDGLRARLSGYVELGARFAKWRAVIHVDKAAGLPTAGGIEANAHALARYAALCQEVGVVPIVEPEVLMDGSHDLAACEAATAKTLTGVFAELRAQRVALEGIVLKPNMVVSGKDCPEQASVSDVAQATIRVFRRLVPVAVPGIAFLSGGQSPNLATAHLQAMNDLGPLPWELTFSYGRALQETALAAWHGESTKVTDGQRALLLRARLNCAARSGSYSTQMETEAA